MQLVIIAYNVVHGSQWVEYLPLLVPSGQRGSDGACGVERTYMVGKFSCRGHYLQLLALYHLIADRKWKDGYGRATPSPLYRVSTIGQKVWSSHACSWHRASRRKPRL